MNGSRESRLQHSGHANHSCNGDGGLALVGDSWLSGLFARLLGAWHGRGGARPSSFLLAGAVASQLGRPLAEARHGGVDRDSWLPGGSRSGQRTQHAAVVNGWQVDAGARVVLKKRDR